MAPAPIDFVDPDGPDPFQYTVRQAPLHKPLDRAIDAFPTGAKGPRRLAPGQPPRPTGEKTHHGDGDRPLAIAPRNVLDGGRKARSTTATLLEFFAAAARAGVVASDFGFGATHGHRWRREGGRRNKRRLRGWSLPGQELKIV